MGNVCWNSENTVVALLFPEQRQHMTNRLKPSIPWFITKRHLIILWLPLANRYLPQVIRTRHKISTSIYGWSLSRGNRRISLMNRTSYSVALNINSPCNQMALYHYLPSIWMVTFNRGNHLLKPIFCNICVSRVVKIILLYSIINNWSETSNSLAILEMGRLSFSMFSNLALGITTFDLPALLNEGKIMINIAC